MIACLLAGATLAACTTTTVDQQPMTAAALAAPEPIGADRPAPADVSNDSSAADFSLYALPALWRNQLGDTLRLSMLSGRVRVVAMVYTDCHATCPLIVGDLKRIEAALLPHERDAVGFVLVSLDPLRDTPGRLTAWAASTELDTARWTLLSGTDDAVRELAASLDVRYQRLQGGELAHTNGFAVLDRTGAIVHRQRGLGGTAETIRTIRRLLQ